jgi:tripartite-type tricarboxylate transporter receptor subunit TctC
MTLSRGTLAATVTAIAVGAPLMAPLMAQTAPDPATYPNQLVRLVVPFSAGSMTDILARTIAERLQERWKQQVIVENRPGLAGTASVAKSAGDGYTLMLTSNGHTVISSVNKNIAFDPIKDFTAITPVAVMPVVLIAPGEGGAKSVKELIDTARAKPGALNYGSAGLGSATGIAAELFKSITKTEMVHVPHKGLPEMHTSIVRGDAAMAFTFYNAGGDLVQSGKMRGLAVSGDKRMAALPDVPTLKEAGLPEFTYDPWFGLMAPAGTPKAIVDKVAKDVAEILKMPDIKARFEPQGVDLVTGTPEAFDKTIRSDTERYGKLFQK